MNKKIIRIFSFFALAGAVYLSPTAAHALMAQHAASYQFYLRALLLENQGNLVGAQAELSKALEAAPDSALLNYTAADYSFRQGNFSESSTYIEKAIALDPNDSKNFLLAGHVYWALGDAEKSEMKLKRAVELAPDDAEPLINLAVAVTPKDPKKALALYKEYLVRHPADEDIMEREAQLYYQLGDLKEAKRVWDDVLEISPSSLRAHLANAQIAEVFFDTATAIYHYEEVLQQDPTNLPLLLRVGELKYRSNLTGEAFEAFSKAQEIAPNSASANFWLAIIHEQRGEWDKAIELLKPIADKSPEPGVMLRLSYYYSQSGRHKEAIQVLKALSAEDPENTDFLGYLAIAYEQNKQLNEAIPVVEKLMDIDPENPDHCFHLATLHDRTGKFEKAEALLRKAMSLDKEFHLAMNYLGYSYAERNQNLEEAEKLVNDAIALDPGNGAYLDSMGWVYYRMGKYNKAEDFLNQAVQISVDSLIWDHLAEVHMAEKNLLAAALAWSQSLRIDPTNIKIEKKQKKVVDQLSQQDRVRFYLDQIRVNYSQLQTLKGLAQIQVCEGKNCFPARAQVEFDRDLGIQAEVPGPMTGPLVMVTRKKGEAPRFGAVHPLFQTHQDQVMKFFDRIYSILSSEIVPSTSTVSGTLSVTEEKGQIYFSQEGASFTFNKKSGALNSLDWKGTPPDRMGFSKESHQKPYSLPKNFSWKWGDNFSMNMEFIDPVFTFVPINKDEEE